MQVMVATVRCEEIANEKFSSFIANEVSFLNTASVLHVLAFSMALSLIFLSKLLSRIGASWKRLYSLVLFPDLEES